MKHRHFVVHKDGDLDVTTFLSGDGHLQKEIRRQRTVKVALHLHLSVTQDGCAIPWMLGFVEEDHLPNILTTE